MLNSLESLSNAASTVTSSHLVMVINITSRSLHIRQQIHYEFRRGLHSYHRRTRTSLIYRGDGYNSGKCWENFSGIISFLSLFRNYFVHWPKMRLSSYTQGPELFPQLFNIRIPELYLQSGIIVSEIVIRNYFGFYPFSGVI